MDKRRLDGISDNSPEAMWCRDLLRGLRANHCTFYVYADNVTGIIMNSEENVWGACLGTLPSELTSPYLEFLQTEIEDLDFKPYPGGSLSGKNLKLILRG